MKAIGYYQPLPITADQALIDLDIPEPVPGPRDLKVRIEAISVNPVDTKVRAGVAPADGSPKILGWDAAGTVTAVGPEVTLFRAGDEVFYAGSIARPGTNAEFHVVDERIVGAKPKSLSWAEAAALPLTAITAWEILFDRLGVAPGKTPDGRSLLIIGGAGGVGSMLIQLAARLTGLTVIATASRQETRDWCLGLGAHHVVDHTKDLAAELKAIGQPQVDMVASLTASDRHYPGIVPAIRPQGKFALIDDPKTFDIVPLKRASISAHWEMMFTRPLFETPDMIAQHRLLNEVSALVDAGVIRTTATETLGPIDAGTLRRAHARIESGTTRGKIVLAGF